MKVGIFGGTFNPVHYGHLINATLVKDGFSLDIVYLVPAKSPVHKEIRGQVTAEDRYEMTRLALEKRHGFEASRIEIDRTSDSYMVYTVRDMRKKHPDDEIFLIIGSDSYDELGTWRQYEELVSETSVIVMNRTGSKRGPESGTVPGKIHFAENPIIEISSSGIRKRIREGRSVSFMLPDPVIEYIYDKGIYTQ